MENMEKLKKKIEKFDFFFDFLKGWIFLEKFVET
jgi:hypothetical protein